MRASSKKKTRSLPRSSKRRRKTSTSSLKKRKTSRKRQSHSHLPRKAKDMNQSQSQNMPHPVNSLRRGKSSRKKNNRRGEGGSLRDRSGVRKRVFLRGMLSSIRSTGSRKDLIISIRCPKRPGGPFEQVLTGRGLKPRRRSSGGLLMRIGVMAQGRGRLRQKVNSKSLMKQSRWRMRRHNI